MDVNWGRQDEYLSLLAIDSESVLEHFIVKKTFFFFLLNLHQYGPLTFCFPPPFQNLKRIKTTSIPPLDPLRPLVYVYTLRKLCNYTILHGNRSFLGFSIKYLFLHFMVIRIGEMKFSRASKNSAIEYISTRIDIILYILHTSCMKNINTPARDRTKSHLRIFFHLRFDFVARVKSNFFSLSLYASIISLHCEKSERRKK